MPIMKLNSMVKSQSGVALLEMMIALFLLGTGLLGYAALQNTALRNNQSALLYSQAGFLARDMAERMQANAANAVSVAKYEFVLAASSTAAKACDAAKCAPDELADWDKSEWLKLVSSQLPSGKGAVVKIDNADSAGAIDHEVVVEFDDSRSGGSATQQIKMIVRLL